MASPADGKLRSDWALLAAMQLNCIVYNGGARCELFMCGAVVPAMWQLAVIVAVIIIITIRMMGGPP